MWIGIERALLALNRFGELTTLIKQICQIVPSWSVMWINFHGSPIGGFRLHYALLAPEKIAEIEPRRRVVGIEFHDALIEAFGYAEVAGLLGAERIRENFIGVGIVRLGNRQHELPF